MYKIGNVGRWSNKEQTIFYERTGFPGIIGCVDETHIKIAGPCESSQHLYFNRKGFFSLNPMIVSTINEYN